MKVLLAERNDKFGSETSSRNSEVIHAGIYYPPGSLKAVTCVDGREKLYAFCLENEVPFRKCGKLIVATGHDQLHELDKIQQNARMSGVDDLVRLSSAEIANLEPDIRAAGGLLSPSTGIIDSHEYMLALLGAAETQGTQFVARTEVGSIFPGHNGWSVCIRGDREPVLNARAIVNAAGLWAGHVSQQIEGYPTERVLQVHYAKGSYFSYSGATSFRRLIYPIPEPGGLGTHLTLDLANSARFGPDVEWIEELNYDVAPEAKTQFAERVAQFWPGVDPDRLEPGYAGIRPKLSPPGGTAADFVVEGPADHGVPDLVNFYGIESPGLTASLSLAELAVEKLSQPLACKS